jgi:hypothetical protein
VGEDGLVAVAVVPKGTRRRAAGWAAALVFFGVIAGTALLDLARPKPPAAVIGNAGDAAIERDRSASFADGSLMKEFEHSLRLRSRVRQTVLPPYSVALWRGLGQVPTELIAGSDGWLFLSYRVPGKKLEDAGRGALAANLITAVHRRLAAAGIDLFVAPIPDKCMVYEEELPRAYAARPDLYHALIRRLRAQEVPTVDLLGPMRAERDR